MGENHTGCLCATESRAKYDTTIIVLQRLLVWHACSKIATCIKFRKHSKCCIYFNPTRLLLVTCTRSPRRKQQKIITELCFHTINKHPFLQVYYTGSVPDSVLCAVRRVNSSAKLLYYRRSVWDHTIYAIETCANQSNH